jgi:hypothetical protein
VIGNEHRTAFGMERNCYPTFQFRSGNLHRVINNWPDALKCAVFDEWIGNSDRSSSNLIFDSAGVYWLIDHDEAFPNYVSPSAPTHSTLLSAIAEGKVETKLWSLRKDAMACVEEYKKIDWEKILNLLTPNELPTSQGHYMKFIEFLISRTDHMHDIVSTSLGIRQQSLSLVSTSPNKRIKEEK